MKRLRLLLKKLLHPPKVLRYGLPPVIFAVLVLIFIQKQQESGWAYPVYVLAAYATAIMVVVMLEDIPKAKQRLKTGKLMRAVLRSSVGSRYCSDLAFRGTVSVYQGMVLNFLYALFRLIAGIQYASVWFLSMAAYYFVLGGVRLYLAYAYHKKDRMDTAYQKRCYRKTAWLLLLDLPMGGMIFLMIARNSEYQYPGYIIYLSAMYTFYCIVLSIINLAKYRRLGSPILSAAKVLNFVSTMMSLLGLQTAMIARFSSEGENFRKLMNTLTGSFVYGIVIFLALYMLLHLRIQERRNRYQ